MTQRTELELLAIKKAGEFAIARCQATGLAPDVMSNGPISGDDMIKIMLDVFTCGYLQAHKDLEDKSK